MSTLHQLLQDTSNRKIMTAKLFPFPAKLSLLSFLGAERYFISDFGLVWNRDQVFLNKAHLLSKYYVPRVLKDPDFLYPWVKIKTTNGYQWFPCNQLLGWAFSSPPDDKKIYFLTDQPSLTYMDIKRYYWTDKLPENLIDPEHSLYLNFMKQIYK
jgi:hypothetical protein